MQLSGDSNNINIAPLIALLLPLTLLVVPTASQQEVHILVDLELGVFVCPTRNSRPLLQLFSISSLCNGRRECLAGADENSIYCSDDKCNPKCVDDQGTCLTPGQCFCNTNYAGVNCSIPDENECLDSPCDPFALCINVPGSYHCICLPGFTGDGIVCDDINECSDRRSPCDPELGDCFNIPGSFYCSCEMGLIMMNDGKCYDIDECNYPEQVCGHNAVCSNTEGSFTCICDEGYIGDGLQCSDINECESRRICPRDAECFNLDGSYTCGCDEGFEMIGDKCEDVNECLLRFDECDLEANCVNTVGSFRCECFRGYTGSGLRCTDLDECKAREDNCHNQASCRNTDGSFRCTCNPGYIGNGVQCQRDQMPGVSDDEDVKVMCFRDHMTVTVPVDGSYNGVAYVKDYYKRRKCMMALSNKNLRTSNATFTVYYDECGTNYDPEREVYSTVVIITDTPPVLTKSSKAYNVKCRFVVSDEVTPTAIYNVEDIPVIQINKKARPSMLALKIFDLDGEEVLDVDLGQELMLTAFVSEGYGVFVRNCIAISTSDLTSMLTLIGSDGCPVYEDIISEFRPLDNGNGVVAKLESFKFPGADNVLIECDVEACVRRCTSARCVDGLRSYGRRKRNVDVQKISHEQHSIIELGGLEQHTQSEEHTTQNLEYLPSVHGTKITKMLVIHNNKPSEKSRIREVHAEDDHISAPSRSSVTFTETTNLCVSEQTLAASLAATALLSAFLSMIVSCLLTQKYISKCQRGNKSSDLKNSRNCENVDMTNWSLGLKLPIGICKSYVS